MFVISLWVEVDELLQARTRKRSSESRGIDVRNTCVLTQLARPGVNCNRETHPFGLKSKRNAVIAAANRQILPAKSIHPSGHIIKRAHVIAAPNLKFLNRVMWNGVTVDCLDGLRINAIEYPAGGLYHFPHGLDNVLTRSDWIHHQADKLVFDFPRLGPALVTGGNRDRTWQVALRPARMDFLTQPRALIHKIRWAATRQRSCNT